MAIEKMRLCGFRKVDGIYIEGTGMAIPCDRLPFELKVCPVCGQGIKFTSGWTWVQPDQFFQGKHKNCKDQFEGCPICNPEFMGDVAGLQWVGSGFYTPENFIAEAKKMGVSKRIVNVPSKVKLNETWVLLVHKKAVKKVINQYKTDYKPGIFYAYKPTRIVKLIWKSQATREVLEKLKKRGITPIVVPDGDKDHDPKRSIRTDLRLAQKETKKSREVKK